MEIIICEGFGGHAAFVVGMGDMVDVLHLAKVSLSVG